MMSQVRRESCEKAADYRRREGQKLQCNYRDQNRRKRVANNLRAHEIVIRLSEQSKDDGNED